MRLTTEDARARFAAQRVARLATAGGDGQPHLVPVTFAVDGDRIYTAVDHKPKKTAEPAAAAEHRGEPPGRTARRPLHRRLGRTLVGPRRRLRERRHGRDRDAALLDLLAERYEQYRRARPAGPVIVIEAERWTGWSGSA